MSDPEKAQALNTAVRPSITTADTAVANAAPSLSSAGSIKKTRGPLSHSGCITDKVIELDEHQQQGDASTEHKKPGPIGSVALPIAAGLVLAWWVSGLAVEQTRSRWIPASLWTWFFVLVILFRFLPIATITAPLSPAVSAVTTPISALSSQVRLTILWVAAVAITFGCAFGAPRPAGTAVSDRVISLAGVYFCQLVLVGMSHNKKAISWTRIPVSLILQQALALFIYKSDAGNKFFTWINRAVADFQECAIAATTMIVDADTTSKKWFLINGLATIMFLAAFVQLLYFFNWMQWLTKQFAWLGENVFGASGAETFVALWTPFFGQVHSAILVNPYVYSMTEAELGTLMTTSMSSASSLQMLAFSTTLPALPLRALLTISGALIPGAVINSKIAFPEDPEVSTVTKTRTSTCAARKRIRLRKAVDMLDAFSDGAKIGLRVAGHVLVNFFAITGLLIFSNGLLIYIFKSFHVPNLDLHLVIAAPLAPFAFFLGVPRHEVWRFAYLMSGKLLVNPEFAIASLQTIMASSQPFSQRTLQVGGMALCNTASLSSLGTQLGLFIALAPEGKKGAIAKMAIPAVLVATIISVQSAAIAASLF